MYKELLTLSNEKTKKRIKTWAKDMYEQTPHQEHIHVSNEKVFNIIYHQETAHQNNKIPSHNYLNGYYPNADNTKWWLRGRTTEPLT